jgi:hypothetical protein
MIKYISIPPFSRIDFAKLALIEFSATFLASSGSVGPAIDLERRARFLEKKVQAYFSFSRELRSARTRTLQVPSVM